jgi:hypothetical protein
VDLTARPQLGCWCSLAPTIPGAPEVMAPTLIAELVSGSLQVTKQNHMTGVLQAPVPSASPGPGARACKWGSARGWLQ